jgi:RimJ/RimL family protein N-acetyltransferase
MLAKEIETHREVVSLKDGVRVLIRPMVREDRQHLVEFFSSAGEDDLRYMRHNVRDQALVNSWCDNLDYEKVLPLLAFVKERIVGSASLYFFEGPKRHIAEYRLFLSKDFRKRGLGMKMTRALLDMARKQNIHIVFGEVIAEQTKVIRAFEQLGFKSKALLEDFFMFPDGDTCDIEYLTINLNPKNDEF